MALAELAWKWTSFIAPLRTTLLAVILMQMVLSGLCDILTLAVLALELTWSPLIRPCMRTRFSELR